MMSRPNEKTPPVAAGDVLISTAISKAVEQDEDTVDEGAASSISDRTALQIALTAMPRTHLDEGQLAWLAAVAYRDELAERKRGRPSRKSPLVGKSKTTIAEELGISESLLDEAVHVERTLKDAALRDKLTFGKKFVGRVYDELTRAERDAKILANVKSLADSGVGFQIIVADPMWDYRDDARNGAAATHYPTSDEAILGYASEIAAVVADDAMLFLWATSGRLDFAFETLRAWGFHYEQTFVWHKTGRIGMGFNPFRIDTEFVLVGSRGKGVPTPRRDVRNIIEAPWDGHSVKPQEFYDLIDAIYPTAKKIDIFARVQRGGWTAFGAEVAA